MITFTSNQLDQLVQIGRNFNADKAVPYPVNISLIDDHNAIVDFENIAHIYKWAFRDKVWSLQSRVNK